MQAIKLIILLIALAALTSALIKDIKNTPKNHPHQLAIIKLLNK